MTSRRFAYRRRFLSKVFARAYFAGIYLRYSYANSREQYTIDFLFFSLYLPGHHFFTRRYKSVLIQQYQLTLPAFSRGFHLITDKVMASIPSLPEQGILHVFIQHTSAGLTLNENADPSVRRDFEGAFNRLAPEDHPDYTHTYEGSDDMPAHIKSTLSGASVTIPISRGRPNLGTWQGIYLCEFRNRASGRRLVLTVYS